MQTKSLAVTLGILGSSALALADHGSWEQRSPQPRVQYDHDSFRNQAGRTFVRHIEIVDGRSARDGSFQIYAM